VTQENRPDGRWSPAIVLGAGILCGIVVVLFIANPPTMMLSTPSADEGRGPPVTTYPGAFGLSGEVRLQLRLPGEPFEFPVDFGEKRTGGHYQWLRATDSAAFDPARPLVGLTVVAPERPGFYHLFIADSTHQTLIDSILVGVMIPFSAKSGSTLNGYKIGTYSWERLRGDATPPPKGFLEVRAENTELPVSTHFRLGDFLTHDEQDRWPKYLALDPRILDKVELVLQRLGSADHDMSMKLNSGYRTPLHNQRVPRAASDSRHQYGDAADLAIDVDGDGKVTYLDVLAVARAVEIVERNHPELTGGLGLYGNSGTAAYVHIDVRGARKRWKG
jgi:uncharacterized protein YcbK (DUF882 family)